jgi:hypothetical protein
MNPHLLFESLKFRGRNIALVDGGPYLDRGRATIQPASNHGCRRTIGIPGPWIASIHPELIPMKVTYPKQAIPDISGPYTGCPFNIRHNRRGM